MKKSILVVIPSYKRYDQLLKGIFSLKSNKYDLFFIIVENSNDDVLFENIAKRISNYDNIKLLKGKNEGFAKSINFGVEYAEEIGLNFDYILLLNDDAYAEDSALDFLVDELEKHPDAVIAGPTIFFARRKNEVWSSGGYFCKITSTIRLLYKNKKIDEDKLINLKTESVDFVSGCVMLIKKEYWYSARGLNEKLNFYEEDFEFCMRAKKSGYKILYVPYSIFYHDIDLTNDRINEFVYYNLARNYIKSRKEIFGKFYFYYSILTFLMLKTPFKIFRLLRSNKPLKFKLNIMTSWFVGFLDGLFFENKKKKVKPCVKE
jgi:hypothetical protein